jgi:hypothetical protein
VGLLALAGALKGAGDAANKGLSQFQTALTAKMLQDGSQDFAREQADTAATRARFNIEDERAYTAKREQELYALGRARKPAEAAEDLNTRAGLLTKKAEIDKEEFTAEEGLRKDKMTEEVTKANLLSEKELALKKRGLDITEQHYKDMGTYYQTAADAAKNKVAAIPKNTMDPLLKARIDYQMKKLDGVQELLKAGVGSTPGDLGSIKAEIDTIGESIDQLVGAEGLPRPARKGIIDPTDTPGEGAASAGKSGPAPARAISTGEDFTVEPKRPLMPRGTISQSRLSQFRKQQLDYDVLLKRQELERAKIHGSKLRVDTLQRELELMESQQDAASERR